MNDRRNVRRERDGFGFVCNPEDGRARTTDRRERSPAGRRVAHDLEGLPERRFVSAFVGHREGARERRATADEQLIEFGARRRARNPDRERATAFLGVVARDRQRAGGIARGEDSACVGQRSSHRSGAAEGARRERDRDRRGGFFEGELTDGAGVLKASAFDRERSGFQGGAAGDRRRATRQYEAVPAQAVCGSGVRSDSRGGEGAVVAPLLCRA